MVRKAEPQITQNACSFFVCLSCLLLTKVDSGCRMICFIEMGSMLTEHYTFTSEGQQCENNFS